MYQYKARVKRKFCKYKDSVGVTVALFLISAYVARDVTTYIFTLLIKLLQRFPKRNISTRALFVEPYQQGYGDLIFQTPLFEAMSRRWSEIDILLNPEHEVIVEGNPFLKRILSRKSLRDLFRAVSTRYDTVFVLTRDTLSETLFALIKVRSRLVLMDKDLNLWNIYFKENHTRAWQTIYRKEVDNDTIFNPARIYSVKKKKINENKKSICLVAGVEDKSKEIINLFDLISVISNRTRATVTLIGKDKNWSHNQSSATDLVNCLSYKETLQIMRDASLVIGPEGSLVHASTTLDIPTIVIESDKRPFWKYSDIPSNQNIIVINETTPLSEIASIVEKFLQHDKS